MNVTKNLPKAAVTVMTSLALVGLTAGAAHASGSIVAQDGGASTTWSTTYSTRTWGGTLTDRYSGDAKCARLYSQGYNHIRGCGGCNLEKTVFAGGSAGYLHQPVVYSDKVDLIVCAGYTNCTRQRVWG